MAAFMNRFHTKNYYAATDVCADEIVRLIDSVRARIRVARFEKGQCDESAVNDAVTLNAIQEQLEQLREQNPGLKPSGLMVILAASESGYQVPLQQQQQFVDDVRFVANYVDVYNNAQSRARALRSIFRANRRRRVPAGVRVPDRLVVWPPGHDSAFKTDQDEYTPPVPPDMSDLDEITRSVIEEERSAYGRYMQEHADAFNERQRFVEILSNYPGVSFEKLLATYERLVEVTSENDDSLSECSQLLSAELAQLDEIEKELLEIQTKIAR